MSVCRVQGSLDADGADQDQLQLQTGKVECYREWEYRTDGNVIWASVQIEPV